VSTLERRVLWLALLAGAPAVASVFALELAFELPSKILVTTAVIVLIPWIWCAVAASDAVSHQLRTLANLVSALREGDYSLRGHGSLGEAVNDINQLSDALKSQRFTELEAAQLLEKVIEEIEVVVLAFDHKGGLRLANRAAERMLGRPRSLLKQQTATALGLSELLEGAPERRTALADRWWELRRTTFRQEGIEHRLLVLADLSRALSEEERIAWQRLVRVLSHEINNSLAPIQSIAQSLLDMLGPGSDEQLHKGLAVIARRSEALARFMRSYATLAKLPPPSCEPIELGPLVKRVAALEKRLQVSVRDGRALTIEADPDQLEQLLINLVQNAADAALPTSGQVGIEWRELGGEVEIVVSDEGPGLPESANLFVPFFTTKEGGSGIGLALSRQIAQAHGGTLTLENAKTRGCEAKVRLPKHQRSSLAR
jgi:two-component system, NtrC family, nitrogen regulation sensor histidine kinase NtrY